MRPSAFRLLARKRLRNLLDNWKQFLSILLMGAIAMTLFVGLFANASSLQSRVEAAYAEGDYPSLYVFFSSPSSSYKAKARPLLGKGDEIDSRLELSGSLSGHPVYFAISSSYPTLSHPYEVSGEAGEDYLLLDQSLSSSLHIDEAAELSIPLSSFSSSLEPYLPLLEGMVKEAGENVLSQSSLELSLLPTGYMAHPENISTAQYSTSTVMLSKSYFLSGIEALLRDNYLEEAIFPMMAFLQGFLQDNLLLIKTNEVTETKEAIEDVFASDPSFLYCLKGTEAPWASAIQVELTEAKSLTYLFPFVFFLVALLVILTTFAELIIKERIEIGTMLAIGVKRGQIAFHYIGLVCALLSLSSLIGFIAGPLSIPLIMGQKYGILYSLPPASVFVFPALPALLSFLFFLLSGSLCAYLATRRQLRLLPSECMRPEVSKLKGKKEKHNFHQKPSPYALSAKTALRSIKSGLFKSAMVVVGVAGCTALLLCGFGIEDTIDHGLQVDTALAYGNSLTISYSSPSHQAYPSYAEIEGVKTVDQFASEASSISCGQSEVLSEVRLFEDEHPLFDLYIPKGTVMASEKTLQSIKAEVGDLIEFTFNGQTYSAPIGGSYESFSVLGVCGLLSDFLEVPYYTGAYVEAREGVDPSLLKQSILDSSPSLIASIATSKEMGEQVESIVSGIKVMTNAVKVFAILLALVVLYNLALLSFRTRFREIATMKVLGFSLKEIGLSLVLEALLLSAVGFGLGCLFGFPFMYAVLKVNEVSLVQFLYTIHWSSYLYAFLLTFVVSFLISLYTSFLAKKVKMVESLKSVE